MIIARRTPRTLASAEGSSAISSAQEEVERRKCSSQAAN